MGHGVVVSRNWRKIIKIKKKLGRSKATSRWLCQRQLYCRRMVDYGANGLDCFSEALIDYRFLIGCKAQRTFPARVKARRAIAANKTDPSVHDRSSQFNSYLPTEAKVRSRTNQAAGEMNLRPCTKRSFLLASKVRQDSAVVASKNRFSHSKKLI